MNFLIKNLSRKNIKDFTPVERKSLFRLDSLFANHFRWNENQWEETLKKDGQDFQLILLEEDKRLLGFSFYQVEPLSDDRVHLQKIIIAPEYRGRGYGPSLIVDRKFDVYLEVEEGNARAIRFYEKEGFCKLRKMLRYYSDGQNAYSMLRNKV